jgi:hypothetical protein
MDVRRALTKRAVVWLIAGLLVGALGTDLWWRQSAVRQMDDLRGRLSEQAQRVDELERKLAGAEAELAAERQRRQSLEDVLTRGRK